MIFTDKAAKEKIATLESRITELEQDVSSKDTAIENLTSEITAKDQTIAEHAASIASRDETIASITGELNTANEALATAQAEITEKDKAIAEAKESAGHQATELLASIGQPEPLEIVAESPTANKSMKLSAFNELNPLQRNEFIRSGGKLTD